VRVLWRGDGPKGVLTRWHRIRRLLLRRGGRHSLRGLDRFLLGGVEWILLRRVHGLFLGRTERFLFRRFEWILGRVHELLHGRLERLLVRGLRQFLLRILRKLERFVVQWLGQWELLGRACTGGLRASRPTLWLLRRQRPLLLRNRS
jgi:hypothetical protein